MEHFLILNDFGQIRASRHFGNKTRSEQDDLVQQIHVEISDGGQPSAVIPFGKHQLVHRRYASIIVVVMVGYDSNVFEWLEWIQFFIEILNQLLSGVREVDFIEHLPEVLLLLDEMVDQQGQIAETNTKVILRNVQKFASNFGLY